MPIASTTGVVARWSYVSGNTVSDTLRVTYDRQLDFDPGVFCVPAVAASVALWTATSWRVVGFPQALVAIGRVPTNLDGDRDVDAADLAAFTGCMDGPDISMGPGCEQTDLDIDNDNDLTDYSEFQRR